MVKRLLFLLITIVPLAAFASDGSETDFLQRTVNFIIFAAIVYYLLADKIKAAFAERSQSIQAELDKVQDTLKESEQKVENAKAELENAKRLAREIIDGANADIESIKNQIAQSVEQDIANMQKHFDEKVEVETRKAKKEVVAEILEELLNSDTASLSQDELANIVLRKVA